LHQSASNPPQCCEPTARMRHAICSDLEASAGAPLGLYLMSADSNASFEVTDPDGNLLCQGQADNFGARQWKGQLGPGGIDTIVVYSDSGTADFQLTVTKP
jgi:hypothetical protein